MSDLPGKRPGHVIIIIPERGIRDVRREEAVGSCKEVNGMLIAQFLILGFGVLNIYILYLGEVTNDANSNYYLYIP